MNMKYGPLLSFCALMTLGAAAPARAQLGVAAGLNFDRITDIRINDQEATFDNATGFHVGLFYEIGAGPISLRPGVFYRDLSQIDASITDIPESFDVNMIEFPIDVLFRLAATPIVKPYASVGPVFSFARTKDSDFEGAIEDFNVAANVGLGLSLTVPGLGLRLYPELRYAVGISRFVKKNFEFLGQTFSPDDTARMSTFMLRLGVGL